MRITTLFRSEIVAICAHLGHERAEQTVGLVVRSGGEVQSIGVGVQAAGPNLRRSIRCWASDLFERVSLPAAHWHGNAAPNPADADQTARTVFMAAPAQA
jgi:hypothetical protein